MLETINKVFYILETFSDRLIQSVITRWSPHTKCDHLYGRLIQSVTTVPGMTLNCVRNI